MQGLGKELKITRAKNNRENVEEKIIKVLFKGSKIFQHQRKDTFLP